MLAVGAPFNDPGGNNNRGHVRVFTWNNSHYVQRGSDIDGEANTERSGTSISISGDGLVLAIGAPFNDGNGTNSGNVRVYIWNSTTNTYVKRGNDLKGMAAFEQFGTSVSLSYRGYALTVGAPINGTDVKGRVRVYTWDGMQYIQEGSDIVGGGNGDLFGKSVSLSATGQVVGIGAPMNNFNKTLNPGGYVGVYDLNIIEPTPLGLP